MTLLTIQRALISVSNKQGLIPFAQQLHALGIELISTGGTSRALQDAGIPTQDVSSITGFPEIMDGRVKTLHPKIHGGILGRRALHAEVAKQHAIQWIDLVVVNLYPFENTIKQTDCTLKHAIENIDIGGPAMIRSAAKNMNDVTVVVDPADYETVLNALSNTKQIDLPTRQALALKAFAHTAHYDTCIQQYLSTQFSTQPIKFPAQMQLTLNKAFDLRYGENPNQQACAYHLGSKTSGILTAKQYQGKELSYNNLTDADAAFACVEQFSEPTCVIVKHANPCGVASAKSITTAFERAFATDSISAFGGIIALNRICDVETAKAMTAIFFEVVIAPGYTKDALQQFAEKPNLRVLELPLRITKDPLEYKWIDGGMLLQDRLPAILNRSALRVVTEKAPTEEAIDNLLFAWQVVHYVKSNAILIAKDQQTIGIGAGQVSRIDAVDIAIRKSNNQLEHAVLASDAFFPFRDSIDRIASTGIQAIIQPGGSLRDQEVIAACNEHGIAMVFSDMRCFKH